MINKDWSSEKAVIAHEAALKADPSRSNSDPTLPLYQWIALHELDIYAGLYKEDEYYLMTAIRVCANHDLPLPGWAAKAYITAYDAVNNAREKSWDKVFGSPYPKGAHLNAIRKKRMLSVAVLNEINLIKSMDPNVKIDDYLFETVGKKFGIGKSLANEYYYSAKNFMVTTDK